jgi:imidazolonepropionase-like amidohydrolase
MTRTCLLPKQSFHNANILVPTERGLELTHGEFSVDDGVFQTLSGSKPDPRDGLSGDPSGIDLEGRWVVPGLWDAHIHLGSLVPPHENGLLEQDPRHHMARCIANAQDNLRHGVTAVRSLGERDGADLMARDLFAAGHLVGPTVFASGEVRWSLEECGVDNFRRQVRRRILEGVDQVKLLVTGGIPFKGSIFSPGANSAEVTAAIDEAHAWGKPVAIHAMGDEAVKMAAECGADTIEHAFGCTTDVIPVLKECDVVLSPQLAVTHYWTWDAVISQGLSEWMGENAVSARRGHHEMFAAAAEAGVKFVAGVDNLPRSAGDYGIENAGGMAGIVAELALMVSLGVSEADAITAASQSVADVCGVGETMGSIERGKRADFLILDANPLLDVRHLENISQVWCGGELAHVTAA